MKIKLSDSQKQKAIVDIQRYFEQERDESIGILAAEMLFNIIFEKIGKTIYNQAIDDAAAFFQGGSFELIDDLATLKKVVGEKS